MYDLKLAAERFGYSAIGVKASVESANKLADPVILLLKDEGFNHFVVLKGITQVEPSSLTQQKATTGFKYMIC